MRLLIVSSDRTLSHGAPANVGDAFLTDLFADALERQGHQVDIADFGAERSTPGRGRRRTRGLPGLIDAIRDSDAVVVGGGTLLQDDRPDRLIGGLPRLCVTTSIVSRITNRPLAFYGVGCERVERTSARRLLRLAVGSAPVWVREEDSLHRFSEMFERPALLGADTSLLAQGLLPRRDPDQGGNQLVLALNRSEGSQLTLEAVQRFRREGFEPTLISMEQQSSTGDFRAIAPDVLRELGFSFVPSGWRAALESVRASRLVVASRMHTLYMALLVGTPAVAIGTRAKVRSFADEFGIPMAASLDDVDFENVEAPNHESLDRAAARARATLDDLLQALR